MFDSYWFGMFKTQKNKIFFSIYKIQRFVEQYTKFNFENQMIIVDFEICLNLNYWKGLSLLELLLKICSKMLLQVLKHASHNAEKQYDIKIKHKFINKEIETHFFVFSRPLIMQGTLI